MNEAIGHLTYRVVVAGFSGLLRRSWPPHNFPPWRQEKVAGILLFVVGMSSWNLTSKHNHGK